MASAGRCHCARRDQTGVATLSKHPVQTGTITIRVQGPAPLMLGAINRELRRESPRAERSNRLHALAVPLHRMLIFSNCHLRRRRMAMRHATGMVTVCPYAILTCWELTGIG